MGRRSGGSAGLRKKGTRVTILSADGGNAWYTRRPKSWLHNLKRQRQQLPAHGKNITHGIGERIGGNMCVVGPVLETTSEPTRKMQKPCEENPT